MKNLKKNSKVLLNYLIFFLDVIFIKIIFTVDTYKFKKNRNYAHLLLDTFNYFPLVNIICNKCFVSKKSTDFRHSSGYTPVYNLCALIDIGTCFFGSQSFRMSGFFETTVLRTVARQVWLRSANNNKFTARRFGTISDQKINLRKNNKNLEKHYFHTVTL